MSLTAAQAITLLSNPQYQTPEGLLNLVRQISVQTPADRPGVTTLLYSGNMLADGSGPNTQIMANYISKNYVEHIRVIDSTEVAKFLVSDDFKNFIKGIISNETARTAWLYDATKGPWTISSEAFVRGAQGPIETFSSFASANRTFSIVEVPVALDTPSITTIGGLKRQDLVDYCASLVQKGQTFNQATAHIADLIAWESRLRNQEIPIALNSEKNSISWASVSKWTNAPASSVPKGVTAQPYRQLAGSLADSDITHIRNILHTVERTGLNATYWRTAASAGKTLGGIGGVLATASLAIAAHDAYQAHQAGNSAQAGKIMATWTGSLAGGALLGSLAYKGSLALLAPLAALGAVGIGIGVGAALLSSLIAGYFGAKGGAALSDKFITQLQTLFNQTETTVSPLITELDITTLKYELRRGTPGNDYIGGGIYYPTRIDGGAGNDILETEDAGGILIGGPGNDQLYLGKGVNTVIYHLGDGQDIVEYPYLYACKTSGVNRDTLQLGLGITPDNIQLVRGLGKDSDNLSLIFVDGGQVLLRRYFDSDCQLSIIRFADGTEWKIEQVMRFLTYRGTAGNDYLVGLEGYTNRIDGGAGNDTIKAYGKDNTLIGGPGNDQLYLSKGDNTVIYHLGDGQDIVYEESQYHKTGQVNRDILQLGADITPDSTQLMRGLGKDSNDLTLVFEDGGQVLLKHYFNADYCLSTIRFANGTEWKMQEVKQELANRRAQQVNNTRMGMIDNQVNQLIQAMASLAPDFSVHTTVLPDSRLVTPSVLIAG